MALQKTLLKKRLKYRHPLTPKTSFCDKTIGSRELIFGTIPIKKCMNNLDFFQPNLRQSSGSHCPVWRGMTPYSFFLSISPSFSLSLAVYFLSHSISLLHSIFLSFFQYFPSSLSLYLIIHSHNCSLFFPFFFQLLCPSIATLFYDS